MKGRTSLPGQKYQDMTARTELTVQDCQHTAAKIRQPGQDKEERSAEKKPVRMIQSELDSQNRSTRTGQADRTDRTGRPAWTVRT
jgi:hypothetical protein